MIVTRRQLPSLAAAFLAAATSLAASVTPASAAALPAPAKAAALTESQKIAALLDAIAKAKDITFIRNDAEWPAAAARQLMESKYGKAKDKIRTADAFIDQIASRSSTTGKVYQVKFKDGRTTESAFWLRARLREIEAGKF